MADEPLKPQADTQRKKRHLTNSDVWLLFFAIVCLIFGISFNKPLGEQIFCALLGFVFLKSAYAWLDEDKAGQAFVLFIVAAAFFLCTLSGMQSLIKTEILSKFSEKMAAYGERIDTFQKAVTDMRDDLRKQQDQLSTNQTDIKTVQAKIQKSQSQVADAQKELGKIQDDIRKQETANTVQFTNMMALNGKLYETQTNLDGQEKKLSDVEYWVQNLYDKKAIETFNALDTNKVLVVPMTNGGEHFVIKLQDAPIRNSIDFLTRNELGIEGHNPIETLMKNQLTTTMYGYNTNNLTFEISYIADSRETNLYQRLPILGREIRFTTNGVELSLPPLPPLGH